MKIMSNTSAHLTLGVFIGAAVIGGFEKAWPVVLTFGVGYAINDWVIRNWDRWAEALRERRARVWSINEYIRAGGSWACDCPADGLYASDCPIHGWDDEEEF